MPLKTMIAGLLFAVGIFADVSVMQRFPGGLSAEEYQTLEAEGTTAFSYFSCYDAFKDTDEETGPFKRSEREAVKAGYALLQIMEACLSAKYRTDLYAGSRDIEALAKHLKELDAFFVTHSDLKQLNLIPRPVSVSLKNGAWHCEEEMPLYEINELFSVGHGEAISWLYSNRKERFKQLLDNHSFTMLALFAEDPNIPDKDVASLNNYCAENYVDSLYYNTHLLDTLIEEGRFQAVKRYKKILVKNYSNNPFARLQSHRKAALLREMGFEFLRYSENVSDTSMEHDDDNLYLAIGKQFVVSDEALWELVDNIPNEQNIVAYLNHAIHMQHTTAFRLLLARYPKALKSKKEVSTYLLYLLKNTTDDDVIKIFMEAYPYDTYDVVVDPETGWNALDYAKRSRHGNETLIKLLKEHGFTSHLRVDIQRHIDYFNKDFTDVAVTLIGLFLYTLPLSGIVLFGILFFTYMLVKKFKKTNNDGPASRT